MAARGCVLLQEGPEPSRSQHPPSQGASLQRMGADERGPAGRLSDVGLERDDTKSGSLTRERYYLDSIDTEAFVFLGTMVPEAKVDVHQILRDFDRLYDLYKYVESEPKVAGENTSWRPTAA